MLGMSCACLQCLLATLLEQKCLSCLHAAASSLLHKDSDGVHDDTDNGWEQHGLCFESGAPGSVGLLNREIQQRGLHKTIIMVEALVMGELVIWESWLTSKGLAIVFS